ncbi:MAG: hypothetical protein ACOC1K_07435 [Nanoarchaeota archaeon]
MNYMFIDMSLETRLKELNNEHNSSFISALKEEKMLPHDSNFFRSSYTTSDLVNYIEDFFISKEVQLKSKGKTFDLIIYSESLNKEPFKRIGYGVLNSRNIPKEVFNRLEAWESAYLLAGVWHEKSSQTNIEKRYKNQTLPEVVSHLILEGIEHLSNVHDGVKHYSKGRKQEYVTEPNLPYAEKIIEDANNTLERINEKYNSFSYKLRELHLKANGLKHECEEMPLFAEQQREEYQHTVEEMKDFIKQNPFKNEFVTRYKENYDSLGTKIEVHLNN